MGKIFSRKSALNGPETSDLENLQFNCKSFIYVSVNDVPAEFCQSLLTCARQFTLDCFLTKSRYNAGFTEKLLLEDGSVFYVFEETVNLESAAS